MKKCKSKWSEKLTEGFLIEQYIILKKSTLIIANEVGCCKETIRIYLNKHGISIKTRSEAAKNKPSITKETRKKISEAQKGENNSMFGKHPLNFKGRIKGNFGYILIYTFNHSYKNNNNQVYEHRLVVENYFGRYLDPKWVVHHINGIKDDNRIENLMCFSSKSAHVRFHCNPGNVKPGEIIFDGR